MPAIVAVVFDLDGILADTEALWDEARREVTIEHGGCWTDTATTDVLGMSSVEWSRYLHNTLGVQVPPQQISNEVVQRLAAAYRERLPIVPHAADAVRALGRSWPLGLASSSNRELIELFLELADLRDHFRATVSSEEVAHGKPAPDVYLQAARLLGVDPHRCVAIEDSTNGILAAVAAGMRTVAVPNRYSPPSSDALTSAARVITSIAELTPELIVELL